LREKKAAIVDLRACTANDFEFVKVANKKIRCPDGNDDFDARTLTGLFKQGAIYVRLKKNFSIFNVSISYNIFPARKS
jgi:hypothetical protein